MTDQRTRDVHELHLRLTSSVHRLITTEATEAGMTINRFATEAIIVRAIIAYTIREREQVDGLLEVYRSAADYLDRQ